MLGRALATVTQDDELAQSWTEVGPEDMVEDYFAQSGVLKDNATGNVEEGKPVSAKKVAKTAEMQKAAKKQAKAAAAQAEEDSSSSSSSDDS